jgi:hypothetical protein
VYYRGSGKGRAKEAATAAISSPLLDFPIERARGVVFNIVGGDDLTLQEVTKCVLVVLLCGPLFEVGGAVLLLLWRDRAVEREKLSVDDRLLALCGVGMRGVIRLPKPRANDAIPTLQVVLLFLHRVERALGCAPIYSRGSLSCVIPRVLNPCLDMYVADQRGRGSHLRSSGPECKHHIRIPRRPHHERAGCHHGDRHR